MQSIKFNSFKEKLKCRIILEAAAEVTKVEKEIEEIEAKVEEKEKEVVSLGGDPEVAKPTTVAVGECQTIVGK